MNLVLDTSGLIHLLAGHEQAARMVAGAERLVVPAIVIGEWLAGTVLSSRRAGLLARFLETPRASVHAVNRDTAAFYAHLFRYLRDQGTPVPTNDLWIAACAMQTGARVLTSDAHYLRMPQILTEFIGG